MRIFPILIADDSALESLGVNEYVNDLFQPLIAAHPQRYAIRPVTVMSVEELEEVLPCYENGFFTWPLLLEDRFNGNNVILESIHQIIYFHQKNDGVPLLRNQFLLGEFHNIWNTMIAPFRTSFMAPPAPF